MNTGNKSEASVGYCTLYGDMAGGFAPIKDIPKTLVFKLACFYNKRQKEEVIPKSILSAEACHIPARRENHHFGPYVGTEY